MVLLQEISQTPGRRASFAPVHESDNSGVTSKTNKNKKSKANGTTTAVPCVEQLAEVEDLDSTLKGTSGSAPLPRPHNQRVAGKIGFTSDGRMWYVFNRSLFIPELEVFKRCSSVRLFSS